jgi:predicted TIM-barrel fold metal-dependent hydrolase
MRCDCHVHVVGPPDRYPQLPTRTFLAGPADVADLRRHGAARGVTRFVVVQPSFYGTDNAMTLDALAQLGPDGRGVAVIDPAHTPPEELHAMHDRGIRGLRINLYSPVAARRVGPVDVAFAAKAGIAHHLGWHVQVIAPLPVLLEHAEMLERSHVPIVIDHYGLYGRSRPDSDEGRRLLTLVGKPHVWVKLSAPYRVSDDPLQTRPDRDWLNAILDVAADRCVWGSDWPHTAPHEQARGPDVPLPYRELSYAQLLDDFLAALPSPGLEQRILVDNPARLYGF